MLLTTLQQSWLNVRFDKVFMMNYTFQVETCNILLLSGEVEAERVPKTLWLAVVGEKPALTKRECHAGLAIYCL